MPVLPMTPIRPNVSFHHPDAMQLVAHEVTFRVARCDDLIIGETGLPELLAVVGNVHLFLPYDLPIVAVRGSLIAVYLINGGQTFAGRVRVIVFEVRIDSDSPLSGVVRPGFEVPTGERMH